MNDVLIAYSHLFIVHASVWVAAILFADVNKNGAPAFPSIPRLLASSVILGSLMGVLTSHAHGHYLSYLKGLV